MKQQIEGLSVEEPQGIRAIEAHAIEGRRLRYYDYCMAAFAIILVCSNLIGAAKVAAFDVPGLGLVTFGAGILFFPLSYVLGDVLTEVYGYARARRVVWVGFAAAVFAAGMAAFVVAVPPAPGWEGQEALAAVLGHPVAVRSTPGRGTAAPLDIPLVATPVLVLDDAPVA